MKRIILATAGFAAASTVAMARSDTDYPHRDWGQVATLDMPVAQATACVAREMGRNGSSTIIPIDGGSDIDVKASAGIFGTVGEPWQTFKLRPTDRPGESIMTIYYRHPVNQKSISKAVARMQKRCLRVAKIKPA